MENNKTRQKKYSLLTLFNLIGHIEIGKLLKNILAKVLVLLFVELVYNKFFYFSLLEKDPNRYIQKIPLSITVSRFLTIRRFY